MVLMESVAMPNCLVRKPTGQRQSWQTTSMRMVNATGAERGAISIDRFSVIINKLILIFCYYINTKYIL